MLARAHFQRGQPEAAISQLSALLDTRPEFTDARLVLLDCLHRSGDTDGLAEAMQVAARRIPLALQNGGFLLCRCALP